MNAVETLKLIGRPNAYYPKLAKPLGGVNPAVLFSQLFYWQDKATSDLGVYKTRDELEEETGLSHNAQRTAIKKLKEKGVLIVTEKRLDHKTFYKIDNGKVNEILANFAESVNQLSRSEESNSPDLCNVEFETTTKSSSLDQEITTKTTTENTTNNIKSSEDDQPKSKKSDSIDFDLVMDAYNDAVENRLPQIEKMTTTRKNLVKKFLKERKELTLNDLINYFYDFVEKAPAWVFGENKRNWKAKFEFIVTDETYTKFREGAL
ncbi:MULTISPECIES: hypothetical protein [unclassified Gilliamella]|uniref:hypothetical protein n=1 Tax=unclassified Gilliamella TaxID=2685620 RepID=UPI00226A6448|nr:MULTISPECIES: hypothetical protein [unclassified Gilliamella]MCX8665956.1 hypothetical protein [Gilliamella sp. B2887]MCX8698280.1 hypothetical protein [Gilliamella sp. B3000]